MTFEVQKSTKPTSSAPSLGGPMTRRTLDFIYLLDCSASMAGQRIAALDMAIREGADLLDGAARSNPEVDVCVRAIAFSSGAWWHVDEPTRIADFAGNWTPLEAGGITDLGEAMLLLADHFESREANRKGLATGITLITDGRPTDDWEQGLRALLDTPWGAKSVRQAITLGSDTDRSVLEQIVSNPNANIFEMTEDANSMVGAIRWASTWFEDQQRVGQIGKLSEPTSAAATSKRSRARNRRIEAAVVGARCQKYGHPIGMRGEVGAGGNWVFTWAMKIGDSSGGFGVPTRVTVSDRTHIASTFACPYCQANGFAICSACHRYTCSPKKSQAATCAWCKYQDQVRTIDIVDNPDGEDRG
jgi:uncharacterized protein YegL